MPKHMPTCQVLALLGTKWHSDVQTSLFTSNKTNFGILDADNQRHRKTILCNKTRHITLRRLNKTWKVLLEQQSHVNFMHTHRSIGAAFLKKEVKTFHVSIVIITTEFLTRFLEHANAVNICKFCVGKKCDIQIS